MGFVRGIERRLERLVEGLSAAVFRGRLQPIDLANRLIREADLSERDGRAGPEIPNSWSIRLHPEALPEPADVAMVEAELANVLTAVAVDRGWRISGPVTVRLEARPTGSPGSIQCAGAVRPGDLPSWGRLVGPGAATHELRDNREIVGRADDADIRLAEARVSRRHALIWREGDSVWIADLGSANGTVVNGLPVRSPVALTPGDLIEVGPLRFSFQRS